MTDAPEAARSDQPPQSWVHRRAPRAWRPYLLLARVDRPIGTWLLLWPCWWSLALAAEGRHWGGWPDPLFLALFGLGALLMRGAGCTFNDIVDRDIDGSVARTALRPIPSGQVSLVQAIAFMAIGPILASTEQPVRSAREFMDLLDRRRNGRNGGNGGDGDDGGDGREEPPAEKGQAQHRFSGTPDRRRHRAGSERQLFLQRFRTEFQELLPRNAQ